MSLSHERRSAAAAKRVLGGDLDEDERVPIGIARDHLDESPGFHFRFPFDRNTTLDQLLADGAQVAHLEEDADRVGRRRVRRARDFEQAGAEEEDDTAVAWPWCLAPHRRPPRRWWTEEHYLAPLARWHRLAFANAANDLLGAIEIAVGSHDGWRVSRERWVAAQRLYADWLGSSA